MSLRQEDRSNSKERASATTIKVQVPGEIDDKLHQLKIFKGKSKSEVVTAALKDFLKPGCRLLQ